MKTNNLFNYIDLTKLDYLFITLFITLAATGLLILASASIQFSDATTGSPINFFVKQLFHLLIGILLLSVIVLIPLAFWEKYDRWILLFGIALLLLVFIPGIGVEVNGANR